jgi:RNase H-fold protein (predicted Holliday junction resolvase)
MNYLGIDYGEVRVGIAKSEGYLAEPLDTVDTDRAIQQIKLIAEVNNIDELVIGDCPDDFLDNLKTLGLPVHQADETLSSHDARQSLMHTTRKRRKQMEHAVSAAIILQAWLDSLPQTR